MCGLKAFLLHCQGVKISNNTFAADSPVRNGYRLEVMSSRFK